MPKKPYTLFAVHGTQHYIRLWAVMSPAAALIDGVPFVQFGKDTTPYLALEEAIEWAEREAERNPSWATSSNNASGIPGKELIKALHIAREKFNAGSYTEQ